MVCDGQPVRGAYVNWGIGFYDPPDGFANDALMAANFGAAARCDLSIKIIILAQEVSHVDGITEPKRALGHGWFWVWDKI